MDFKTWLGKLDLFYKYVLVFGGVVALVVIFAVFKLLLNKRRLRKHGQKLSKHLTTSVDDPDLEICEKNEGSLFGIRAIEAGFFGGVVQSPSNSVPSTPRMSTADLSGKPSPLLKPIRPHTTLPTFSPGSSILQLESDDPDAITPTHRKTVSQPSLKSPPFDSSPNRTTRSSVSPRFPVNSEGRGLQPSTAQLFGHHSHEPAFMTLDPRASPDGSSDSEKTLAQNEQTARRDVFQHSETLETLTSPVLGHAPLPDFKFENSFTLTIDRPALGESSNSPSLESSKQLSAASSEHSLAEKSSYLLKQKESYQASYVKVSEAPPAKVRQHAPAKSRELSPGETTQLYSTYSTEPPSSAAKPSLAKSTESSGSAPSYDQVVDSPRSSTATVGLAEFPTPPSVSDADTRSEGKSPTRSEVHVARPQIRNSDTEIQAFPMKAVIDSSSSRSNDFCDDRPCLSLLENTYGPLPGSRASQRRSRSLESLARPYAQCHTTPSMSQQRRLAPNDPPTLRAPRKSTDMLQQHLRNPSADFASPDVRPRSQGRLSMAPSHYSNRNSFHPGHRASRVESYHSSFSFVPTPTIPEYPGRGPQTSRMDYSPRSEHVNRASQIGRPSHSNHPSFSGQLPHPRPHRHSRQSSYSDLSEHVYLHEQHMRLDSRGRPEHPYRHRRQPSSQGSNLHFSRPLSSHPIAPPTSTQARNMATVGLALPSLAPPGILIPSLEAAVRRKPVSGAYDPESLARFR